jgi:hypothetical protein
VADLDGIFYGRKFIREETEMYREERFEQHIHYSLLMNFVPVT